MKTHESIPVSASAPKRLRGRLTLRSAKSAMASVLVATISSSLALTAGLATVGVTPAGAAATKTYAYVAEPFTGANVHIPANWVKPLVGGVKLKNFACLTGAKATTAAATPTLATSTPANPIAPCWTSAQGATVSAAGTGFLRLTRAATNEDGGVAYRSSVPTAQGLDISFNAYMYGGTGADGIVFFLAGTTPFNPHKKTVTLGPFGGHLGYSGGAGTPPGTGLSGGYMGFGLDTFGNFTRTSYNGTGCTNPPWANNVQYTRSTKGVNNTYTGNVTIRGPGTTRNGYCLLASTRHTTLDTTSATTKKLDLHGALRTATAGTTAARSQVPIEIAINPTSAAITSGSGITVPASSYVMAVSPLHGPQTFLRGSLPTDTFLQASHPTWVNSAGVPKQFIFGWTGSTGGSTDFHEIRDMAAGPLVKNPPRFGISLTDNSSKALVAGSTVIYTANPVVSATGGAPTAVPTVTTVFPALMTPGTATGTTWSCKTTLPSTVTCTFIGAVPAVGTALPSITIPAKVTATATLTKQVTTYLSLTGSVVGQASDIGVVGAAKAKAFLGLTMADSNGGALVQGKTVNVTAVGTISLRGTNETVAPKFTTTFPANLTPGTPTIHPTWTCPAPVGQVVTCTFTGTLPIAKGTTLGKITIPATIATFATGSLPIPGTLSSTNATPLSVTATDFATVVSLPQLKLGIADTKTGVFAAATPIRYTLTPSVSTAGFNEADAPTVTDSFPTYFTTVVVTTATNWTCPAATGTAAAGWTIVCKWKGAPIQKAFGAAYTPIILTATTKAAATAPAGTVIDNTANISSTDAGPVTATDYADIGARPVDLTLTLTSPSGDAIGGQYSLVVHGAVLSAGGKTTVKPTVSFTLPAGDHLTGLPTGVKWVCAAATTAGGVQKDVCTYTTAAVPSGTTLPALTAVIKPTVLGQYNATVEITDTTDRAVPVFASVNVDVTADPKLTLPVPTGVPVHRSLGAPTKFTAKYIPTLLAAGGPAYHEPTVVLPAPPAGLAFTGAPASPTWTCTPTGLTYNCTSTAALPLGAGALPALSVGFKTTTVGAKTYTATLIDAKDVAATVKSAFTVTVTATPVLTLTQTVTPTALSAGTKLTLKDKAALTGAGTAYVDPVIVITPAGLTFTGAPSGPTWTCVPTGLKYKCTSKKPASTVTGIPAGTTLGTVTSILKSGVTGTVTVTTTLTDPTDGAVPVPKKTPVSVTADPVLSLGTKISLPAGASVGTTYSVTLHPALLGSGGVAHHKPTIVITLSAGQKFKGKAVGATWTCATPTTGATKETCTSKKAAPIAVGPLGTLKATVTITATGTESLTAVLSDLLDNTASVTLKSTTMSATADPVLGNPAPTGVPVHRSLGAVPATFTATYAPVVTSGPAYNDPTLAITVPAGVTFTGLPNGGATWTCVVTSATVDTCTSTKTTKITAGPLGPVTATFKDSTTGKKTITATLADGKDVATTVKSTGTVTVTATPVLTLTQTVTPTALSAGTKLTLKDKAALTGAGTAYVDPVIVITPAGLTFTGAPSGPTWTCVPTGLKYKCTSKKPASTVTGIPAGTTLGTVTSILKSGVTGTVTVTTTLTDPTDGAVPVPKKTPVSVTADPVLSLGTKISLPAGASVGTTYSVTLHPALLGSGGVAHHKPTIVITLSAGQKFKGKAVGATWTCATPTTGATKETCTSKKAAPIAVGPLGTLKATVTITATGTESLTAVLSDLLDNTASVTLKSTTMSATPKPILVVGTLTSSSGATIGVNLNYRVTIPLSITGGGGPAHHDPTVVIKITTTGETLTNITGTTWKCTKTTTTLWKCTSTKTSLKTSVLIPTGALPSLVATIHVTKTGTQTITATLSDPADGAAPKANSLTVKALLAPTFTIKASGTPTVGASVGTSYVLTVKAKTTNAGNQAATEPTVKIQLSANQKFRVKPSGTKWNCKLTSTSLATCVSTRVTPITPGTTFATIVATVTIIAPGASTATATIADITDHATPMSTTTKAFPATKAPDLVVGAPVIPTAASAGSSFTVSVTPSLGPTGPAYNDPSVKITLPAGETFSGTPSKHTKWKCTPVTSNTLTCVATNSVSPTAIPANTVFGTITVPVTVGKTASGPLSTTILVSDPGDKATPGTSKPVVTVTPPPILTLAKPAVPAGASKGTSFPVTLTPVLSALGGPAYHDPTVTITAGTGEQLSNPTGATWSCAVVTVTKRVALCTSTHVIATAKKTAIPAGSLKPIKVTVSITGTGNQTLSAKFADTKDAATPVTATAATVATLPPTMKVVFTSSAPAVSLGSRFTLTATSSLGKTGPAYHEPVLTVTLPVGEKITGFGFNSVIQTCKETSTTTMTCTSKLAASGSIAPTSTTLPRVNISVLVASMPATPTVVATETDPADAAAKGTAKVAVTVTPTPVLTLTIPATSVPVATNANTNYTLKLTSTLSISGGVAYHDPTVVATLPAGQKFTADPHPTTWNCVTSATATVLTCVSTKPTSPHIVQGPLKEIAATVHISTKGTPEKVVATLSDTADAAVIAKATRSSSVTGTPKIIVTVHSTPTPVSSGTPTTLVVTTTIGPTGKAHHEPVVTVKLPTGETFTGTPVNQGPTWACTVTPVNVIICTSTVPNPIPVTTKLPTLRLPIKIKLGKSGKLTGTVTGKDPTDGNPGTLKKTTTTVTPTPVLTFTAVGAPPVGASTGTTFGLTLIPGISPSGGPANHDPKLTVHLSPGQSIVPFATPTGWKCTLAAGGTQLSCSATGKPQLPAGPLPTIHVVVNVTVPGTETITGTLADPGDVATPAILKTAVTLSTGATYEATKPPIFVETLTTTPSPTSAGTTLTLVIKTKLAPTPTGGPAYHEPTIVVTLPPGETFKNTPVATSPGWTCKKTGAKTLTCTSTHKLPITPGTTLGPITIPVKVAPTANGTLVTTIKSGDPTDNAPPNTTPVTQKVTPSPKLVVTTNQTPAPATVGTTTTLTVITSITGTKTAVAYHDPVVTVNLPPGEKFTGTPKPTGWTCTVTAGGTVLTCTSTATTPIPVGPLGPITAKVTVTSTGTKQIKITVADPKDGSKLTSTNFTSKVKAAGHVPVAPVVTASAQDRQAKVTWVVPPTDIGTISSFTLIPYRNGVVQQAVVINVGGSITGTAGQTDSYLIKGITNQPATYVFSVAATNAIGTGPAGTSNPVQGRSGFWMTASDGGVFNFGNAKLYGSMGGKHLNKPIVGIAPTFDNKGYYLVASDGGIFAFGDAHFHGSMGNKHLNKPVVGMTVTPTGQGYYMVASDGGIFSFGKGAKFYGSTGNLHLNKPINGMAIMPTGHGYWMVASDGGIFAFGKAHSFGSTGGKKLAAPIVGMASTRDGKGYWLLTANGHVYPFGDAKQFGTFGSKKPTAPLTGIATSVNGSGYWVSETNGVIRNFGDAEAFKQIGKALNSPVVAMAPMS